MILKCRKCEPPVFLNFPVTWWIAAVTWRPKPTFTQQKRAQTIISGFLCHKLGDHSNSSPTPHRRPTTSKLQPKYRLYVGRYSNVRVLKGVGIDWHKVFTEQCYKNNPRLCIFQKFMAKLKWAILAFFFFLSSNIPFSGKRHEVASFVCSFLSHIFIDINPAPIKPQNSW